MVVRNEPHPNHFFMPAGSDYLHQRPRSPYWYYVRDVPEDVRAKAGVAKWKRSLRTTVRAEAIKEARRLAVEHDQIIEDVRRSKVDRLADLPPPGASASRPPGDWTSTSSFSTDGLWKAAATWMGPITAAG